MTDSVTKRGGYKGGSRKGVPNKATSDARAAIALFVDTNASRLQGWLDDIAEGRQEPPTSPNAGKWLVLPNPQRAAELFLGVVEYHVPKLARTELTGKDGTELVTRHVVELHEGPPPKKETP